MPSDYSLDFSLLIAAIGLTLVFWRLKADYDIRRREKSIDSIRNIHLTYSINSSRFLQLAFTLEGDKTKDLLNGKQVYVSNDLATRYLPEVDIDPNNEQVLVKAELAWKIRFEVIAVMNAIEELAIAYKSGVLNREMVDEAFFCFFIEKKFLNDCIKFRDHYSNSSWQSLETLYKLMQKHSEKKPPA